MLFIGAYQTNDATPPLSPQQQAAFDALLAFALNAFALNDDDTALLSQAILAGRVASFQAAYTEAATLFNNDPGDAYDLSDEEQSDQEDESDDAAAGIAATYHNDLANQINQQLAQMLQQGLMEGGAAEHAGAAEGALATGLSAWASNRAEWKSPQIANAEAGAGANAGTNAAVDDILSGDLGLPEGVNPDDVLVTVLPDYSSTDFCADFAGNTYSLDQYYDLPDFPAHANCIHEKVLILNTAVSDLALEEEGVAEFTPEEIAANEAAMTSPVTPAAQPQPQPQPQQPPELRNLASAGGKSVEQLQQEVEQARQQAEEALARGKAAATQDERKVLWPAYDKAQFAYERAQAELSAAQGGRGAIVHYENYPFHREALGDLPSVEEQINRFFGRDLSTDEVASLVGAPEESYVKVTAHGDALHFELLSPGYDPTEMENTGYYGAQRTLIRGRGGVLTMENDSFYIDAAHQGQGLGTEIFSDEAHSLSDLGVRKIATFGAEGAGQNGYYTWPRLGYVGKLPDEIKQALADAVAAGDVPKAWGKYTRVEQLMKTADGAAWWKANGVSLYLEFDLRAGSKSLQLLDAYVEEKAAIQAAAAEEAARAAEPQLARRLAEIEQLTTTKDAVAWLTSEFPQTTWALKGGADLGIVQDAARAFSRLADDYPDAFAELRVVGLSSDASMKPYMQEFWPETTPAGKMPRGWLGGEFRLADMSFLSDEQRAEGGVGMLFNASNWKNPDKFATLLDQNISKGFWQEGAREGGMGYVVTHEFGHVIEDWLETLPEDSALRAEFVTIERQALDYQLGLNGLPQTYISQYATKDAHEIFAEAFAALSYGPDTLREQEFVERVQQLVDAAAGREVTTTATREVIAETAAPAATLSDAQERLVASRDRLAAAQQAQDEVFAHLQDLPPGSEAANTPEWQAAVAVYDQRGQAVRDATLDYIADNNRVQELTFADRAQRLAPDPITLAAAQTADELTTWAQQAYPDMQLAIGANVEPALIKHVLETSIDLARDFPTAFASLNIIATSDAKAVEALMRAPRMDGFVGKTLFESELQANPEAMGADILFGWRYLSSEETWNEIAARAVASGYWTQGETTVGAVFTHEFGHALLNRLENSTDPAVQDALSLLKQHLQDARNTVAAVSVYANASREEMFAETFVALRYGDEAQQSPLARELQQLLDRAFPVSDLKEQFAQASTLTQTAAEDVATRVGAQDASEALASETAATTAATAPVASETEEMVAQPVTDATSLGTVEQIQQRQAAIDALYDIPVGDPMTLEATDEAAAKVGQEMLQGVLSNLAQELGDNRTFLRLARYLGYNRDQIDAYVTVGDTLEEAKQHAMEAVISELFEAFHSAPEETELFVSNPLQVAIQEAAKAEFGLRATQGYWTDEQIAEAKQEYGTYQNALKVFLRQMYDDTQAWFADQGISELQVFRGVRWQEGAQPTSLLYDKQVTESALMSLPLSSWSTDASVAMDYATASGVTAADFNPADYGAVLAGVVPVDQVLSLGFTGFGAPSLREALLLGGEYDMLAMSFEINDAPALDATIQALGESKHMLGAAEDAAGDSKIRNLMGADSSGAGERERPIPTDMPRAAQETLLDVTGPIFTETGEAGDTTIDMQHVARTFGGEPEGAVNVRAVLGPGQALGEQPNATEIEVLGPKESYGLTWDITPGAADWVSEDSAAYEQDFSVQLSSVFVEDAEDEDQQDALFTAFDRALAGLWNAGIEEFQLPDTIDDETEWLFERLDMDPGDVVNVSDFLHGVE